jgi:hypothetical protein
MPCVASSGGSLSKKEKKGPGKKNAGALGISRSILDKPPPGDNNFI